MNALELAQSVLHDLRYELQPHDPATLKKCRCRRAHTRSGNCPQCLLDNADKSLNDALQYIDKIKASISS